jgi:hypothetical protein
MRWLSVAKSCCSPLAVALGTVAMMLALGLTNRIASAEDAQANFEVHDVSLWILEPGATQANMRTAFPSALTGLVDSARNAPAVKPQAQGVVLNAGNFVVSNNATVAAAPAPEIRKGKIAPINLLTFHGQPATNLDVDLRTKAGSFLAHWPAGESLPNRLRWSGTPSFDLVEKTGDDAELAFVNDDGWVHKARQASGLFVKRGARAERFLAYDVELNLSAPIRLEGGPDKFKVINTSNATLRDVLISRGTPQGRRVAWIDVLPRSESPPIAAPTPAAKPVTEKPGKDKSDLFDDAKPPAATRPEEKPTAKPSPVAGSTKLFGGLPAAPRAAASVEQAPAKPVPAPATPPDAEIKKSTEPGKPVAAAADDKQKSASKPTASAEQGVEVTLSEPLAEGSEQAISQTTKALADRLARTGLSADEAQGFVERFGGLLFEGDAVVVACRMDAGALDEKLPLSVFPEPIKIVRVPIVVLRNADPQLPNEVDRLIVQLGDRKFAVREAAQQRLLELGPLAFPALQKSLNDADLEIVIRAEWLLLNQNQTPNAPAKPAAPAKAAAALPNALLQPLLRLNVK